MPIKKFNVKAGLSVGTTTITDVIDSSGNATFNDVNVSGNINAVVIRDGSSSIIQNQAIGITAITTGGNTTQFMPSGQINLGGSSTVAGGTYAGSQLELAVAQTNLKQLRDGDVTVQVGTNGTATKTWVFANNGNLALPGNIAISGDIIPTANVTHDIGSANMRFRDLWLSNSTIHLGDVPLSVDANGVMTVSDQVIVTQDAQGGLSANTLSTTGNTVIGGNLTIGGSTTLANAATTSLSVSGTTTLGNIGNVKITGGGANNVIITNGSGNLSWAAASSVSAYKYSKEWHVDPVGGNDTTGNGSESNPYATITKAFTQVGGNGQAVFLHHGIYNETVTCGLFNVDIIGDIRGGAFQQGTWTFTTNGNSSVRISGVHFTNTVSHTGNAGVYFDRVTSQALISKSGAGLLNVQNSDLAGNAVSVTGNGYVTITNSMVGPLTVNASGAQVVVKDSPQVLSVTNTSGVAVVNSSFVFALSNTGNAITSVAGSLTYIQNSSIAAANGAQGRIAMGGFWSTQDTSYDKANSSLTGTNLAVVAHSDAITTVGAINAGTTVTATGNITGGNITTANYVKTTSKTVATLASAATVGAGSRSFVSDATSTVFGDTAVGGGSNFVPVWSNGTNWLVG